MKCHLALEQRTADTLLPSGETAFMLARPTKLWFTGNSIHAYKTHQAVHHYLPRESPAPASPPDLVVHCLLGGPLLLTRPTRLYFTPCRVIALLLPPLLT